MVSAAAARRHGLTLAAAALVLALLLAAVTGTASATYRKPPFNGSIFGKRTSTNTQELEAAAAAGKALSALCEVAAEACSAWFPQNNELN